MKRTFFGGLMAALALCFAFCWRAVEDAAVQVGKVYRAAKARVVRVIDHGLKLAAGPLLDLVPRAALHRAHAFYLRLVKRDRPVITATWRMCPST